MAKNFDAADISHVSDACVKCGQCLPHCPTYRLSGHESQSPRGRLDLLRLTTENLSVASKSALDAIEDCLSCAQCERHCPLHLPVTAAIAAHRGSLGNKRSKVEWISHHPRALGIAAKLLRITPDAVLAQFPQTEVLQHIKHRTRSWAASQGRAAQPHAWIAPGCTGHSFEGDTLNALLKLAEHLGESMHVLPAQCCGSLAAHRGHLQRAQHESDLLGALVPASSDRPVIHLNTGCRDQILRSFPQHRVIDAIRWLHDHRGQFRWRAATNRRVAVHWPCTSEESHRTALLALFGDIPGLSFRELNQNAGCCGAAGDHFERNPDRALAFRANWMVDWQQEHEPLVLSGNIGCTIFLGSDTSFSATIQHPLAFLASQLETSP